MVSYQPGEAWHPPPVYTPAEWAAFLRDALERQNRWLTNRVYWDAIIARVPAAELDPILDHYLMPRP